jgi:two-component system sensor histidine kinase BaeS
MAEPTVALPRYRARRTGTLTTRAVLVTTLAALVSVLVTALVAFPVAVRKTNSEARASLADKATLVATVLSTRAGAAADEKLVRQLRQDLSREAQSRQDQSRPEKVDIWLVTAGRADHAGLPPRIVAAVAAGRSVSQRARVNATIVLLEGRPVPGTTGSGVVLAQRAATGARIDVWSRLWLPLLAGLLAGVLAGFLLARRLARPIRRAAAAAARLSAGDRSVRVPPEPPAEAAELAHALNDLAAALATSEGRQREFLLSVSHELRTPLTTIKGYAEALADGVVGPDGAQRAGQTMLAEAGHLDRLVADLLALARLEAADFPLEIMPVDLTALVRTAAEAWGGRCAAVGVVLGIELPAGAVVAATDPGRVRQIIDGLLENALRVVPPGAPVVLAAGTGVGYGLVEVRDGGPGFTDEDLAVAFERGALTQRYRGVRKVGSGLGLAIAAGLARRMGGTISAGHAPEGGARFTVHLPLSRPAPATLAAPPTQR